jgi:hypothetical protein
MSDSPAKLPNRVSTRLYWSFQLGGWGLITLVKIFAVAVDVMNLPRVRATVELLLLGAAGLILSHGLRGYVRRHRWDRLSVPRRAWRIVVAGFVLGTPLGIITQMTAVVAALQDPRPLLQAYSPGLGLDLLQPIMYLLQIVNSAALFVIWLILYFTAISIRAHRSAELRQSELARALQLAELRLLKTQLNPHFLFNALNTVRSLIADDPPRAQGAVTRLANTLRYTLRSGQDELVTLAQELEIVADYLELESMRFEDRLRVEYDVTSEAGSVPIPVMLLQTVVENAIKHGIAELPSGGVIKISGVVQNHELVLEVKNPRPAAAPPAAHEGIGLRNADERLRLLFGSRASLDLDFSQPAIVTARVRIPSSA